MRTPRTTNPRRLQISPAVIKAAGFVNGKTMAVETKSSTKVKNSNHKHPFSLAFSPRRMTQPDFDKRTPPARPESRATSTLPAQRLPWHKRSLPSDWTEDEVLFFTNWRNELERLHQALISTAADRPRLLRRARKRYMRLAYGLKESIREAARRAGDSASPENSAEALQR
jgi:hypothetical protein